MLMSILNMKLRDSDYESLGDLCSSLGLDEKEIVAKLSAAGFDYMPEIKQFR